MITVLAGVMVASIAITCSASLSILSHGCKHGYNGAYYYDQGWARVRATEYDYYVEVGVVKSNGVIYGKKTSRVNENNTETCYSYKVQGTGGLDASVTYYEA